MRYAAFISYSSLDRALGERLQRALETFVVPAPLRGQDFGRGPVSKRITPIFRDRWDASANADLGATLQAALHASDALIVLCSPAAARSKWVGEEIRAFKRAGRRDRIYPVLIDGLPGRFDPVRHPQGVFPPALFEHWDEAGVLHPLDDPEPLAPDMRPEGDGLHFTVLKLVAALTLIPLTTLTQRQAEAERKERNTARWIAGAMAVLALGAVLGAWTSWQAHVASRTRLENSVEMAARHVDDTIRFHDHYGGVSSKVIHELLMGARKDFDELTQDAPATPTLGLQRVRLDRLFAEIYEATGDGEQHEAMARRALDHVEHVPTQRHWHVPDTWFARLPSVRSVEIERALAQEIFGRALAAQGDLPNARSAFQSMARLADALADTDGDATARLLAANARAHLAQISYESADLEVALQELSEATKILTSDPPVPDVAADLAQLRSDEAGKLFELGRHDEALAQQRSAVETLAQEPAQTPQNQRALAVALARRGDMLWAIKRDKEGALADYLEAQSMLAELLASDPARTDIKRDFSLAQERVGDILLQAEDVMGAAKAFAACLTLRRQLVVQDQSNTEWRRDLSVALERTGAVASLQGRHVAAFAAFNEALELRTIIYRKDENDIVATRDLAILRMQMGKAHVNAHAQLSVIEAAYAEAISLLPALINKMGPESRLIRDLALAYAERGEARRRAGRTSGACSDMQEALHWILKLRATAPEDMQLAQDETWLKGRLKRLTSCPAPSKV